MSSIVKLLPLSLGDVSPGDEFVKLEPHIRADGLPDGIHTGGVWVIPCGTFVWKPLDCLPYPNAEFRCPTKEDICLLEMEGAPGFPRKSFCVVERHGRRWLVRPKYLLVPQDVESLGISAFEIEQGVRELNERHWELNDAVQAAVTGENGKVVILDLSAAQKFDSPDHMLYCNEWQRINKWWREIGHPTVAEIRERARHLIADRLVCHIPQLATLPPSVRDKYLHVYASRLQHINCSVANIPHAIYVPAVTEGHQQKIFDWVITQEELGEDLQDQYGLTWAWSPIGV